jgi:hypothetical protein
LQTQIGQIQKFQNTCSNLNNNLNTMTTAGNNALNKAAQQQQQQNAMNPSSANNQPQMQAVASPDAGMDCTNPVNAAQCAVQPQQAATKDSAGSGASMQDASAGAASKSSSGFNVGDPGAQAQNPNFPSNNNSNQPQQPMSPYAGGSSSGFGFGGDSGSANHASPPNARRMMAAASSSGKTDILKGERAGSGYSSPVSRSIASVSRRRGGMNFNGFGKSFGGGEDLNRMRGLDLKQYLPGGARDGTRRLSGVNFAHPDIHSQYDNLWSTVSNRFRIHCKLQLLYDCR